MELGRINEDAVEGGETPFRAGAVANEHGDIWTAPRTVVPWGKLLLRPEDAADASLYGWQRRGDFDGVYERIERSWRERPC